MSGTEPSFKLSTVISSEALEVSFSTKVISWSEFELSTSLLSELSITTSDVSSAEDFVSEELVAVSVIALLIVLSGIETSFKVSTVISSEALEVSFSTKVISWSEFELSTSLLSELSITTSDVSSAVKFTEL